MILCFGSKGDNSSSPNDFMAMWMILPSEIPVDLFVFRSIFLHLSTQIWVPSPPILEPVTPQSSFFRTFCILHQKRYAGCDMDICKIHGYLSYAIFFNIPSYRFDCFIKCLYLIGFLPHPQYFYLLYRP